jgi:hypothetical protein
LCCVGFEHSYQVRGLEGRAHPGSCKTAFGHVGHRQEVIIDSERIKSHLFSLYRLIQRIGGP